MSDTITILGQKLKKITPEDSEPFYETADVEEDPCIRAWAPAPVERGAWQISILGNSSNLPLAEGATLEEAEAALVKIIKKYESSSREYLSSLTRLLSPKSSSRLERGPESVVVNGRTFIKEETLCHYSTLVEVYRAHTSFVLKRCVSVDRPDITLWHVCYGTTYEGYGRATPEIALKDALESVRAQIKDVSDALKKRQEVLKSLEDLAKDLNS